MNRITRTAWTACLTLAMGALPALAENTATGTLTDVSGKVLVNTGGRFARAKPQQAITAGSRILVGIEATASIVFPDCTLPLEPGKIHTVKRVPCAVEDGFATAPEDGEAPQLRNTQEQWDITASTDAIPVPVNGTYYLAPPPPAYFTTPLPGMMMAGGMMVGGTFFAFNGILEDPVPESPTTAP